MGGFGRVAGLRSSVMRHFVCRCWRGRVRPSPSWQHTSLPENSTAPKTTTPRHFGNIRIVSDFLYERNNELRFAGSFAPKSKFALFLHNQTFNLMANRWVADLVLGPALSDKIALLDYEPNGSLLRELNALRRRMPRYLRQFDCLERKRTECVLSMLLTKDELGNDFEALFGLTFWRFPSMAVWA